jgi:hypothetical protein
MMRCARPIRRLVPILALFLGAAATPAAGVTLEALALKGHVYRGGQDYNFRGEKIFDPDSRWTAGGAAALEWKFQRRSNFRLVTEALFWSKQIEGSNVDFQGGLDYLSVPLLAKLQTADERSNLYFLVGLSADFVTRRDALRSGEVDVFEHFRDVGLGVHAGLGLDWGFSERLGGLFELRYSQDVLDAWTGPEDNPLELEGVIQRGLMLALGLRVNLVWE